MSVWPASIRGIGVELQRAAMAMRQRSCRAAGSCRSAGAMTSPDDTTAALSAATWDDFAALVEGHRGVWGGCWRMAFHPEGQHQGPQRRALKEQRVREGRAHASLVYAGTRRVGWCQFGPTEELPRVKHLRMYSQGLQAWPDGRITCFFVDKEHRRRRVATAALPGRPAEPVNRAIGLAGHRLSGHHPQGAQPDPPTRRPPLST